MRNCPNSKDRLVSRLNKQVMIQRLTSTLDEYRQPLDNWEDVATVWAGIEPLQGNEFFAAMRENAEVTVRIRIRYREGIDRTMRVKYGDQEFEILYIIHPKLAKRELQLMCKERQ